MNEAMISSYRELHAAFDATTESDLRARGGMKWAATPPGLLAAWVAEMDFGVPEAVSAALHELVDRGEFGYVSESRALAFQESVAGWYAREYGFAIDAANVHPVGDVIDALRRAIDSFSAPDARVVVPVPSYPPFLGVPGEQGRAVVTVPMSADGGFDLDAIDAALAEGPSLFVLCNPYNPLGTVHSRTDLAALAAVVERRGGRVFSDEIHAPLVLSEQTHIPYASVSPEAAGHSVTAFSPSKAFNLPALKTAALLTTNAHDLEHWQTLGPLVSHGASVAGLVAGTAALTADRLWLNAVVDYLRVNRDLAREAIARIPGLSVGALDATYLLWIDASGTGVDRPAARLADHGVLVSDGADFGGFDKCIRLNIALPRPLLRTVLERFAEAF